MSGIRAQYPGSALDARTLARSLLQRCIPAHEWASFKQTGELRAIGSRTGKEYLIRRAASGNVFCGDYQYCAAPSNAGELPIEDTMLAQKLLIETNEREFLRIAQKTHAQRRSYY